MDTSQPRPSFREHCGGPVYKIKLFVYLFVCFCGNSDQNKSPTDNTADNGGHMRSISALKRALWGAQALGGQNNSLKSKRAHESPIKRMLKCKN